MAAPAESDMLFGVTALQLRFVTPDELAAATAEVAGGAAASVRQHLCAKKVLSAEEAELVARAVEQQLARFGSPKDALDSMGVANQTTDPGRRAATHFDRYVTRAAPTSDGSAAVEQRFTVLRMHQQGGLGRLSIARDGELNREIALKEILPTYADDEDNRRRFVREAEITGALEHPGVVPVYSLGEFPDGRPYYAMRLIKGVDLRTALEDFRGEHDGGGLDRLAARQFLTRFVSVCHAIDYAHNRGVIHRDIKPGNIMLGDFGETLVVDWGLARMLDDRPTAADLDSSPITTSDRALVDQTMPGRVVGTLPYVSPEQAQGRGDLLGPPTDIYGLGATLYHILTGRPPFDVSDGDIVYKVQHGRFPRPRQVDKRIPKPLEAICLKAMARQPTERYATARQLALDVERFLADEPVEAYAEPLHARSWRWIRRHRAPVMSLMAAAAVAVAALSAGVVLLSAANRRVSEAGERAEQNFRMAQDAVRNYYVRISEEELLNQPGMQPLRDRLLRQALEYYQGFLEQRHNDPTVRADTAEAHFNVGRISETLESPEKALPHYREAARLQRQLSAGRGASDALQADLAQTLNAAGRALFKLGRRDEARAFYEQAADIRKRLADARPEDADRARAYASSVMNLGLLHAAANEPAKALELLERAQSLRLVHNDEKQATNVDLQRDLGTGYYNIAASHTAAGDSAAAERSLAKAVSQFERVAELQPNDFDNRRRLGLCQRMVAMAKAAAGETDEAIELYQQARETLQELVERNPGVAEYASDLAGVRMDLGLHLGRRGDAEAGLTELDEAIALLEEIAPSGVPRYRRDLAAALRASGQSLDQMGQADEARQRLARSREILEVLVEEYPDVPDFAAELERTTEAIAEAEAI